MAWDVAVIGAGSWGTALALASLRAGNRTLLWCRRDALGEEIAGSRRNEAYLPGIDLPANLSVTAESAALAHVRTVLLAVPAQRLSAFLPTIAAQIAADASILICAKGIEAESGRLLDAVVAAQLPGREIGVLSGPSFAQEVARGLPTAVTVAAAQEARGRALVGQLGSATFRPYWSADVTGVLLGGAMKNVIAIAAGIARGYGLGENAQAALITRGMSEMMRLGDRLGAARETLMGLSGLGDLILTCTSGTSRNYAHGLALGAGKTPAAGKTVEGAATAEALLKRAEAAAVELPIVAAMTQVLAGRQSIPESLERLLSRPFRAEG